MRRRTSPSGGTGRGSSTLMNRSAVSARARAGPRGSPEDVDGDIHHHAGAVHQHDVAADHIAGVARIDRQLHEHRPGEIPLLDAARQRPADDDLPRDAGRQAPHLEPVGVVVIAEELPFLLVDLPKLLLLLLRFLLLALLLLLLPLLAFLAGSLRRLRSCGAGSGWRRA